MSKNRNLLKARTPRTEADSQVGIVETAMLKMAAMVRTAVTARITATAKTARRGEISSRTGMAHRHKDKTRAVDLTREQAGSSTEMLHRAVTGTEVVKSMEANSRVSTRMAASMEERPEASTSREV